MVLYFQFLKFIIWCFFVFTIMSIPAYVFYFSGNSSGTTNLNVKSLLAAFSIGNIGQCMITYFPFITTL